MRVLPLYGAHNPAAAARVIEDTVTDDVLHGASVSGIGRLARRPSDPICSSALRAGHARPLHRGAFTSPAKHEYTAPPRPRTGGRRTLRFPWDAFFIGFPAAAPLFPALLG
jgi:hypothetical protein